MLGDKIVCTDCYQPKNNFTSEMLLSIPFVKTGMVVPSTYGSSLFNRATSVYSGMKDNARKDCFNKTVNESLDQFLAKEKLDKQQKIYCEACKAQTNVQK